MHSSSFDQIPLPEALSGNLASLGYTRMTPVQAESLPLLLQGRDLIVQARTGSGKTVAFGLGLLAALKVERFRIQSLVLCPTRELADQVSLELRKLARAMHNVKVLTLCGGTPIGPQIGSLEHGAHIIVGTPGRIEDHLRKGRLELSSLSVLVLDEADRMLDMGFQPTLEAIVDELPARRQTLLFSATFPDSIEALAASVTREPQRVTVDEPLQAPAIEQRFYRVADEQQRRQAVTLLLSQEQPTSALVFCNTRRECDEVANGLRQQGFAALPLHGDMEQRDRDQVLVQFANHSVSVLVATDVAARGLDIEALDVVINYQLARDPEVHVHRIGRTGRAGLEGRAHTLYSAAEAFKLERLQVDADVSLADSELPDASVLSRPPQRPAMVTLQIDGGKKNKLRPGDILGALTRAGGVAGDQVGKIRIFDLCAYVAVRREVAQLALQQLTAGKLKGRNFRARQLRAR